MAIILRVIVSESNIKKLKVEVKTLLDLNKLIRDNFSESLLPDNFVIQYFDKDFNDFVNIQNFDELENFSTVRIKPITEVTCVQLKESQTVSSDCESSINSSPSVSSASSLASFESAGKPSTAWPEVFPLPQFEVIDTAVDLFLKKNAKETKAVEVLPEHIKRRIVSALTSSITKYTLYPKSKDIDNICFAFIHKYPFMRDGSPGGHSSWAIATRYKVCNMRKGLKGISPEVYRNKRLPGQGAHAGIKKARRGITRQSEYLPEDDDDGDLKEKLKEVLESRGRPNMSELSELMDKSWTKRWTFIQTEPPVDSILAEWPAYIYPPLLYNDFQRLTNVKLEETFVAGIDRVMKKISGKTGRFVQDSMESNTVQFLKRLPDIVGLKAKNDKIPHIVCTFELDVDDDVISTHDAELFVAELKEDEVSVFSVVVEKQILKKTFQSLSEAVVYLFGMIWVFNLKYPKPSAYLWEFIEKFVLQIDTGNLSVKLMNLKVKYSL